MHPGWFVLLGGSLPPVHLSIRLSVCWYEQSVHSYPTTSHLHTKTKYIYIYIFALLFLFSPIFPPAPLSLSLFLVSTLSVWQGSTESCNNIEEEEMKGRKGTCPTFTYSACLLFTWICITLLNFRLDRVHSVVLSLYVWGKASQLIRRFSGQLLSGKWSSKFSSFKNDSTHIFWGISWKASELVPNI